MTRRDHHNESVFRWYWKNICRAYRRVPHAFTKGCGRDSLAWAVHYSTGAHVTSAELRMHLEEAAHRGWISIYREKGKYTRFKLR